MVPPWLRNSSEFRALVAWLLRHGVHVSAFHGARSPLYVARLVARSPRGGWQWRAAVHVANWVLDREQASIREGAIQRGAVAEYLSLSKQRRERVKARAIVVAAGLIALVIAYLVGEHYTPGWFEPVVVVAVVCTLGVIGTTADRRIINPATVTPFAPPRLTEPSVTRALRSLGVSGMTGKDADLTYPAPITRDGPGWRADVDLPHG